MMNTITKKQAHTIHKLSSDENVELSTSYIIDNHKQWEHQIVRNPNNPYVVDVRCSDGITRKVGVLFDYIGQPYCGGLDIAKDGQYTIIKKYKERVRVTFDPAELVIKTAEYVAAIKLDVEIHNDGIKLDVYNMLFDRLSDENKLIVMN